MAIWKIFVKVMKKVHQTLIDYLLWNSLKVQHRLCVFFSGTIFMCFRRSWHLKWNSSNKTMQKLHWCRSRNSLIIIKWILFFFSWGITLKVGKIFCVQPCTTKITQNFQRSEFSIIYLFIYSFVFHLCMSLFNLALTNLRHLK